MIHFLQTQWFGQLPKPGVQHHFPEAFTLPVSLETSKTSFIVSVISLLKWMSSLYVTPEQTTVCPSVCRMYVFGGWIPVPESDKHNALGTEWICTNSLSVLNLGQYFSPQVSHTPIRVLTPDEAPKSVFIGSVLTKCGVKSYLTSGFVNTTALL